MSANQGNRYAKGNPNWVKGTSGNPAGRPKGSYRGGMSDERLRELIGEGITPLEYMLAVLRDDKAHGSVRLDASKAAAPYVHKKMPIAIEGGDPDKPIRLDSAALKGLSKADLLKLNEILSKVGLADKPENIAAAVAVAESQKDDGEE